MSTSDNPIRKYLDDNGLTQRELAEQLGITLDHVNRLATGKAPITASVKGRFAERFGFDTAKRMFEPSPSSVA